MKLLNKKALQRNGGALPNEPLFEWAELQADFQRRQVLNQNLAIRRFTRLGHSPFLAATFVSLAGLNSEDFHV